MKELKKIVVFCVVMMLAIQNLSYAAFAEDVIDPTEGESTEIVTVCNDGEHTFGEATWSWDGYDSATATAVCETCNTEKKVEATISSETVKEATEDEEGQIEYTATAVFDNETVTDTKTETIAKLEHTHNYGAAEWNWTGYEEATASFTCEKCEDVQTVKAEITSEVTTEATEDAEGLRTYTATASFEGQTYTDTKTETIAKLEHTHSYGPAEWNWTGYEEATASFTCEKCEDVQTVKAEITSEITAEATEDAEGLRTYTATASFEGQTYKDTKTETIAKLAHVHKVSFTEATEPTCTTNGNIAYYYCDKCGQYFSDAEATNTISAGSIVIPATGHDYGEPVWTWDGVASAKATFVCNNDGTHVQEVDASLTSEITKQPTEQEEGTRVYTATVSFNEKNYTATAEEILSVTGHNITHFDAVESTCTTEGNIEYYYCSGCDKYYTDAEATNEITLEETKTAKKDHTFGKVFFDTERKMFLYRCSVCNTAIDLKTTATKISSTKATTTKDGTVTYNYKGIYVDGDGKTHTYPYVETIKSCAKIDQITLSTEKYIYNGKTKKPSVTVIDADGVKISSKYYSVSYPKGRKYVGTYKVTIKFKGDYSGTVYRYFIINPKTTSLSSVSAKKKKSLYVKWKKYKTQTTGYQVQIATDTDFTIGTKTYTISKNKTTSKTISSLTEKTTYYVRIRTYKTVKGKKYYSSWSSVKSRTTL